MSWLLESYTYFEIFLLCFFSFGIVMGLVGLGFNFYELHKIYERRKIYNKYCK